MSDSGSVDEELEGGREEQNVVGAASTKSCCCRSVAGNKVSHYKGHFDALATTSGPSRLPTKPPIIMIFGNLIIYLFQDPFPRV